MPYNGSGGFTLSQAAFVSGTVIASAAMNSVLSDIATNGLSKCVTVDGQNPITGQLKFPNGTAAAPSHAFANDLTTGMYFSGTKTLGFSTGGTATVLMTTTNYGSGQSGAALIVNSPSGQIIPTPVGTCVDFAGSTAPLGWLLCFGQVLNISSYPELGGLLGATYGGNGTTTFGVPDCRGRATYGQDNMGGVAASRITVAGGNFDGTVLGGSGGGQNQTLTAGQLPAHTHSFSGTTSTESATHTHSPTGSSVWAAVLNNQAGFTTGNPGGTSSNGAGATSTESANHTHTYSGTTDNGTGGSGSHPIINPAIIFNKIIFAGRQ